MNDQKTKPQRFKMPKGGHFTRYCFGCQYWTFERQVGCAYEGTCHAISGEIEMRDAYDPPCGLWKRKTT